MEHDLDLGSSPPTPATDMEVESGPSTNALLDIDILDVTDIVPDADSDMAPAVELLDEVEMSEAADDTFVDEYGAAEHEPVEDFHFEEPPPFRSPPMVQTLDDTLQTQALGHSSRGEQNQYDGEGEDHETQRNGDGGEGEGPEPQHPDEQFDDDAEPVHSTSEDGHYQSRTDGANLATQHQGEKDGGKEQEQTMENDDSHVKRLRQSQRQDHGDGGPDTTQTNEVTITEDSDGAGGFDVETNQRNSGPGTNEQGGSVEQINVVNVHSRDDDCASNTASGASLQRPRPGKELLSKVRGPVADDETEEGSAAREESDRANHLRAPLVRLTYDSYSYDLFCEPDYPVEDEEGVVYAGLLLDDVEDHAVYYHHLESFAVKLREIFQDIEASHEEMVLAFGGLEISVPEDNVYTRELSLYDIDRLHIGAGFQGPLPITLVKQPRLIHRFNVLAQHIANSHTNDTPSNPSNANQEQAGLGHEEEHGEPTLDHGDVNDDGVEQSDGNAYEDEDEVDAFEDAEEAYEEEGEVGHGEEEGVEEVDRSIVVKVDDEGHAEVEEAGEEGVVEEAYEDEGEVGHGEEEGVEEVDHYTVVKVDDEWHPEVEDLGEEGLGEEIDYGDEGGEETWEEEAEGEPGDHAEGTGEVEEAEAGAGEEDVGEEEVGVGEEEVGGQEESKTADEGETKEDESGQTLDETKGGEVDTGDIVSTNIHDDVAYLESDAEAAALEAAAEAASPIDYDAPGLGDPEPEGEADQPTAPEGAEGSSGESSNQSGSRKRSSDEDAGEDVEQQAGDNKKKKLA